MKSLSTHKHLKLITLSAMIAALTFAATFLIKIPLVVGYVHIGDGLVFLAAALLPAPYAVVATAIGVSLADLCSGYVIYIPITALIRILTVLAFSRKKSPLSVRNIIGLIISILICAVGYWGFEAIFIYKSAIAALAGVPFNLAQSAVGAIIYLVVSKTAGKWLKKAVEI
jgi:uncharacterized repeat protein (TIGR04002 family)